MKANINITVYWKQYKAGVVYKGENIEALKEFAEKTNMMYCPNIFDFSDEEETTTKEVKEVKKVKSNKK